MKREQETHTVLRVQRSRGADREVKEFDVIYQATGNGQYAHHAAFVTPSATKRNQFDMHNSRDGGTTYMVASVGWKTFASAALAASQDACNYGRDEKTCYQKFF